MSKTVTTYRVEYRATPRLHWSEWATYTELGIARQCRNRLRKDDGATGTGLPPFATRIVTTTRDIAEREMGRDERRITELESALKEAERVIRWAAQESQGKVRAELVGGWVHHADSLAKMLRTT